jgi:hypothetical protein
MILLVSFRSLIEELKGCESSVDFGNFMYWAENCHFKLLDQLKWTIPTSGAIGIIE